ncbi:hypothetical protein JCM10914A_56130 [Paenibacillus sp. JCM 10914]|nr:hypothetical protein JCM10914_5958 [Paenibacillus sp. JCM 10914]
MARRKKNYEYVMDDIFGSLEFPIFECLMKADSMLSKLSEEASCFGVPAEYRKNYMRVKITDMIDQIAERRETEKKIKPSGRRGLHEKKIRERPAIPTSS